MLALFYFVYTILVYFSVGKDRAFCVMLFLEMDFFSLDYEKRPILSE